MGTVILWVTAIIGASALIGKALIPVAALTATKKDDKYLGIFNSAVAKIKSLLDKVGLNG